VGAVFILGWDLGLYRQPEMRISAALWRAVELDSNFAFAFAALGIAYSNLGQTSLAAVNLRKAYDLRQRTSEREKFHIAATYYMLVTGELDKANQQFRLWIQSYPKDAWAHGNFANIYAALGQYEKAASEAREAVASDPDEVFAYTNLGGFYLCLNRLDEAKATFNQALARRLDDPYLRANMYLLSFLNEDLAGMEQQLDWAASNAQAEDQLIFEQSDTEAYYGRSGRAREFSQRAVESARRNDAKETAASYEAKTALREVEIGDVVRAPQAVTAALTLASGRDVRLEAALAMARTGDGARALKMADN
jgi:tetratricopeptide (TPR) repeat protein